MSIKIESRLQQGSNKATARKELTLGKAGERFHLGGGAYLPPEAEDRRPMRAAIVAALFLHVVLFLITFPKFQAEPRQIASGRPVYMVEPVRFKPPPPRQQQKALPERKVKKIPIPDPTPDEPEPILVESEIDTPDVDIDAIGDYVDVPEGPVGFGPRGPLWVEGNVMPPEKVFAPQPRYTEEARKARIQGVVILQAIVDAVGNVTRVQVLKGLPQGLDESAVATVQTWKYKPATLEGEPVPVYLNLTISFSLQ